MDDDLQDRCDRWFARIFERGLVRREASIAQTNHGTTEVRLRWRYNGGIMATAVMLITLLVYALPLLLLLIQRAWHSVIVGLWCGVFVAAGVTAVLRSARSSLVVSESCVRLNEGWSVSEIPVHAIRSVRVEAISSASWNPYVAVDTDSGTLRIARGVSEETAQNIASAIRRFLPPAA